MIIPLNTSFGFGIDWRVIVYRSSYNLRLAAIRTVPAMQDFADDLIFVYSNACKFNALAPDILSLVDKVKSARLGKWLKTEEGNKAVPSRTASRQVVMDGTTKAAALKVLSVLKTADR